MQCRKVTDGSCYKNSILCFKPMNLQILLEHKNSSFSKFLMKCYL